MKIKIKYYLTIIFMILLVLTFGIMLIFGEKSIYSKAERRKLKEFPRISFSGIESGKFMSDFEEAVADNFPLRDYLRKVKAYTVTKGLMQWDNNGIYTCGGHISKLEYPLRYDMLDNAAKHFEKIYQSYFKDTSAEVYFSVVPDKNMYLAKENGYLSLDYSSLISYMKKKTAYMKYIDITPLLSADDYYTTDSHWKQECITDTADYIANEMGTTLTDKYIENTADNVFYGVYYGQSALNFPPDTLKYLTNEATDNCTVTIYPDGAGENTTVYNMDKLTDKDPYEIFLSGAQPIVEIENPDSASDKKLVIFRDSFASSLAPLLISGYSKITLIDTRYVQPSLLGQFIDSDTDDVLFIYSTLILNSSLSLG